MQQNSPASERRGTIKLSAPPALKTIFPRSTGQCQTKVPLRCDIDTSKKLFAHLDSTVHIVIPFLILLEPLAPSSRFSDGLTAVKLIDKSVSCASAVPRLRSAGASFCSIRSFSDNGIVHQRRAENAESHCLASLGCFGLFPSFSGNEPAMTSS